MKISNLAICVAGMIFHGAVFAAPVLIDFESDSTGAKPNGFISVDASAVSFSDSIGANLSVSDFAVQSDGNGLGVFSDDPSALIMDFSTPHTSVSLDFGNDDACCSAAGDVAHLSIWMEGAMIAEEVVVLNRDDIMNQTISYTGEPFDQAIFAYASPALDPINLIEIVDNIIIDNADFIPPVLIAVPTLSTWGMALLLTLFGVIGLRRARSVA